MERAKFPFENEAIREAARHILRDEIPVDGPTHQDNRVSDLKMLGFTLDEILNTPAKLESSRPDVTLKIMTATIAKNPKIVRIID